MNSSPRWTGLGLLTLGTAAGLSVWWGTSASDEPVASTAAAVPALARQDSSSTDSVEARRDELDPAALAAAGTIEAATLPISAAMAGGDSAVMLTSHPTNVRRSPQAVEWEIAQLASAEGNRRRIASCIAELAADGSAEALDVLVGLLEGDEPDFVGKAEMLARALLEADDERIYPAALAHYTRLAEREVKDTSGIRAALQLVVHHGGLEASDLVLDVVDDPNGHLRAVAASLVVELDRESAPDVARKIRDRGPMASLLIHGLLGWRCPEAYQELLVLACDEGIEIAARENIVRGLARTGPPDLIPELTRMFRDAADPARRMLALHAVQSLEKNPDLAPDERERLALPVISAALVDPDLDLRSQAALVLRHGNFSRRALEPLLRQAMTTETDPDQIQRLLGLMGDG